MDRPCGVLGVRDETLIHDNPKQILHSLRAHRFSQQAATFSNTGGTSGKVGYKTTVERVLELPIALDAATNAAEVAEYEAQTAAAAAAAAAGGSADDEAKEAKRSKIDPAASAASGAFWRGVSCFNQISFGPVGFN